MMGALGGFYAGLDSLLHREILRLRARYQLSLDEFRGLYVSDEQVEALLRKTAPDEAEPQIPAFDWKETIATAVKQHKQFSRLAAFGLSAHELAMLLIALAPAFDAKYEALYGYLNNDVTRKLPTLEMALRLLAAHNDDLLAIRSALTQAAPLMASGLVRLQPVRDGVPGAAGQQMFYAHAGLANYLMGMGFSDDQIADAIALQRPRAAHALLPASLLTESAALIKRASHSAPPRLVILEPSATLSANAFALALCSHWKCNAAILDLRRVPRDAMRDAVSRGVLFACLNEAPFLIEGMDALQDHEGKAPPEFSFLRAALRVKGLPVLAEAPRGPASGAHAVTEQVRIALPALDAKTRRMLWDAVFEERGIAALPNDKEDIAARFRLNVEAMEAVALRLADSSENGVTPAERSTLFAAARAQSDTQLARLAQRVSQRHTWADLVLPQETKERVRGLIDALAARDRVLGDWGMGAAAGTGGLRALFAGPPGTGKTMTAGIVARELGLDAYRIDLSQIVSKYIGETEKNLERIFQGAAGSNAILFFDEADALFGKRSEVKDAHDRYANIEVAYLLQRIEDFDGIAILATNVSRNIDAAFSRRMHFVIEFPQPGAAERERLWRGIFPAAAPIAPDIDYEFLARRFELAGGDIRNVALDAAFLAARSEGRIGMRHIVQAVARELVKQGRSPSATDFRQHYVLLDAVERAG